MWIQKNGIMQCEWLAKYPSESSLVCQLPGVQLQPADVQENGPISLLQYSCLSVIAVNPPEDPLHKYSQPPVIARCKPLTLTNYSSSFIVFLFIF